MSLDQATAAAVVIVGAGASDGVNIMRDGATRSTFPLVATSREYAGAKR